MRAALALGLVAAAIGVAHADEGKRTVGILDVRVEGVAPEAKLQFGAALEQQLATSHYTLLTQPKMHEAMASSAKFTEGCVVGECLMDIRAQTHADLVLLVAFNGSGTTYGYVVTLVRTAPLGDPLEIKVRGYHLTLRKTEAEHVLVEPAA